MTAFRTLQPPQNKKTYTESLNKDTYLWTRTEEQHQHVGVTLQRLSHSTSYSL